VEQSEIRRKVRCGACRGKLTRRLNLVQLQRRARWQFPVCGNVLTGEAGLACAILCDRCAPERMGQPFRREILEAVEFTEAGPVYHPVETLEEVPSCSTESR
jgi:hypothetical protein